MAIDINSYTSIKQELDAAGIVLIAVSKTKPADDIRALYELGHRDFGENYVQEMLEKAAQLPTDIRWHFIGHLQTNKVKLIAPMVQLIHGVDSLKLLKEINKEAGKAGRRIDCLLQVHIAEEETKFGFDETEIDLLDWGELNQVQVKGLMGMASFSDDTDKVRLEFRKLRNIFEKLRQKHQDFSIVSMGMSGDYRLAMEEGTTMVRIGSLLFGQRN